MALPLALPSTPPEPTSGVFRRAPVVRAELPDPVGLAAEIREATGAEAAFVLVREGPGRLAASVVAAAGGVRKEPSERLLAWLAAIEAGGPLLVPSPFAQRVGARRVLAVPAMTPFTFVGAVAIPITPGWGPLLKPLERLATDFALRAEAAERLTLVARLRGV